MKTKHIIVFTLINIYTIQATSKIGAKSLIELNINEPVCTTAGVRCHNCWTSLNCIDLGNDTFYPELQRCAMGRTCKNKTGFCEPGGNYECSNLDRLKCHTEGVFPSPFNNMEYFTCVRGSANTLLKYVSKCSPSYKFDPAEKLCRRKIRGDDSFSSLVPVCKFENEVRPFYSYPKIFYRCEKEMVDIGFNFIPHIYGCDFDMKFNGTDCVDNVSSFIGFEENEKCFNSGNFPHPTDCRKYYSCMTGRSPMIMSCSYYEKYDHLNRNCRSDGSNC